MELMEISYRMMAVIEHHKNKKNPDLRMLIDFMWVFNLKFSDFELVDVKKNKKKKEK